MENKIELIKKIYECKKDFQNIFCTDEKSKYLIWLFSLRVMNVLTGLKENEIMDILRENTK